MAMKRLQKKSPSLLKQVHAAGKALQKKGGGRPEVLLILGTGLGQLSETIQAEWKVDYAAIPYFPKATVESHSGRLIYGTLAGKRVLAMEGRFHCYEGYSMQEVAFPVRVAGELGVKKMIVTNAAGGLNLGYQKGDIAVIEDHINFMGTSPLVGPNEGRLGPRFPDMSAPYSPRLAMLAMEAARKKKISLRRGVYIGVTGPNLETRAEYRMMRAWGADLVGMSTVPEVIAAVHQGMEVLGLSVVTDLCDPDHLRPVDIQEIIRTAHAAGPRLDKLVEAVLEKI